MGRAVARIDFAGRKSKNPLVLKLRGAAEMDSGCTPPDETHPRYREWLKASVRHSKGEQKLHAMSHVPETDPEFAAALVEWQTAKRDYEKLCESL